MNTNATKTASKTTALIALAVSALAIPSAHAVNPTFVAGDLVLFFQQFGGPAFPMMVDLGAATLYRDATVNILNIVNVVSGPLSAVNGSLTGSTAGNPVGAGYGANWFDR